MYGKRGTFAALSRSKVGVELKEGHSFDLSLISIYTVDMHKLQTRPCYILHVPRYAFTGLVLYPLCMYILDIHPRSLRTIPELPSGRVEWDGMHKHPGLGR